MYLETSAKSGENVEESFLKCCKTILAKIQTGNFFTPIFTLATLPQVVCSSLPKFYLSKPEKQVDFIQSFR